MAKEKLNFGKDGIGFLFRSMFFPTLIAMVFNSLLNFCDVIFVGQGVGSHGLAAINIVVPLFLMSTGVGLMFAVGASVMAGIRLAEDRVREAGEILTQAFVAGGIIFGGVICYALFFTEPLLKLLGSNEALQPHAKVYMLWLLPGLFAFFLQCVGMMLIRLDGSPKYAMSVQVVAAVINIFLDWLMVFPLDMGLKGASIATSFSCCIGGLMVLAYFIWFSSKIKFQRIKFNDRGLIRMANNLGNMMKLGSATFIGEIAIGVLIITGNYVFLARLGEDGVAAFSIACYLSPMLFAISSAIAQSAQPIISFNYGARQPMRVNETLQLAVWTAIITGSLISFGMWVGAPTLVHTFLSDASPAYAIAVVGLPIMGLSTVPFSLNMTFIGFYQSIERPTLAVIYIVLRGFVFLIPLFFILPDLLGNIGLWWVIPMADVLTLAIVLSVYFIKKPKLKEPELAA